MRNFSKSISKIFTIFFFVFTAFLFLSMVFFSNSSRHISIVWRIISFILAVAFFFLLAWLFKFAVQKNSFLYNKINKYYFIFILFGFIFVFILQFLMVSQISTDIGWDCGALVVTAMTPDMNFNAEYFSIYPNNLFLLFVYRFIIVIFTKLGIQNIWLGFSVINVLLVDFSICLAVLVCTKQWGKKTGLYAFILSILLFGFSPWLMVPYSDTVSMPFVIGSLTLYFFAIRSKKTISKIIFSVAIGITLIAGYFIKPTVLVAGVAIIIVQLLRLFSNLSAQIILRQVSFMAVIVLAGGAFFGVYQTYQKNQQMIDIDGERAMPAIGFYMMGLTISGEPEVAVYGAWNQEDIDILFGAYSTENMRAVAKDEISIRLQKMGPFGYLHYLTQKARWITADGIFYWAGEGRFANWTGNTKQSLAKDFYYPSGPYYQTYQIIAQGIWEAFFFFLVLGCILSEKNKGQTLLLLLRIAMFGVILFVMLFEGRSRYLINFIPVFAVLSANGFQSLFSTLSPLLQKKILHKKS